jgi:hypothetical protein
MPPRESIIDEDQSPMSKHTRKKSAPTQRGFSDYMIGVDPATGDCEVGPWPDSKGWSKRYLFIVGGGWPLIIDEYVPTALRLGADRRKLQCEMLKVDGYEMGEA